MAISHDEEESLEKTYWKLYFNGASNVLGHGIGTVLITPKGLFPSQLGQTLTVPTMWQNMKLEPWAYRPRLTKGLENWKYMVIRHWSFISYEKNGKPEILI